MVITKYPQSCLLLEKDHSRILIDPGVNATSQYNLADFGRLDAVVYTHSHNDHFDPSLVTDLIKASTPIYGNSDVVQKIPDAKPVKLQSGKRYTIGEFSCLAIDLKHCLLVDGTETVQNTGLLIDGHILLPGDSVEYLPQIVSRVETIALPIIGPDISFLDAAQMAIHYQAKQVIPVHHDGVGLNPQNFAKNMQKYRMPFAVHVLQSRQSVKV